MFHIDIKDVTRTAQLVRDVMRGDTKVETVNANTSTATKPRDIMQRLLNNFETNREQRYACNKLCTELEDCVELMSKTPKSVASTCIYMTMSDQVTKAGVCEMCGLSVPTLNKIEIIIKKHLESKM
jgi:transcription initiation factor TFIIIB Brf1 subunit/transcription initiation factor TFIIB